MNSVIKLINNGVGGADISDEDNEDPEMGTAVKVQGLECAGNYVVIYN